MNKKLVLIIAMVTLGIVSVAGITYAIYTWAFDYNGDVAGSLECFDIVYAKGSDIGSENEYRMLMPSSDYTGGLFATVVIGVKPECTINGNGILYLNTDSSTSEILLTSGALKYQVIENSITKVASGTVTSGEVPIYSDFDVTNELKQYTVSVWLDGSMINDSNMNDILTSSYIGNISMKVESGDLE